VRSRGFEHEGLHQIADQGNDALDCDTLRQASSRALQEAHLCLSDIGTFQLDGPCTVVEALASEALGLFARGQGAAAARARLVTFGLLPERHGQVNVGEVNFETAAVHLHHGLA
jgi:acetyl-CoA C-acetyltransferase